jgi:hypothetical protein
MTKRKRWLLGLLVILPLMAAGVLGNLTGLATLHTEYGFYEPVWHPNGTSIYYLERRSRGFIVGAGWEHFTAPARVYLLSDEMTLVRHDLETDDRRRLHRFDLDPHIDRWVNRYHNRIFGWPRTVIEPSTAGAAVKVSMSIPLIPTSELWRYTGEWNGTSFKTTGWDQEFPGSMASSEQALHDGLELMAVRNAEAYGAAILQVKADSSYKVLVSTNEFTADMVTTRLFERSRRAHIEKMQRFRSVNEKLVGENLERGLSEGAAMLHANDDMEEMGLLPRSPRISAVRLSAAPLDSPVFIIPSGYFKAGLFTDIGEAIASPGTEVKASTGGHLKYYEDDVGPRLKRYRNSGQAEFVIETDGVLYQLSVK